MISIASAEILPTTEGSGETTTASATTEAVLKSVEESTQLVVVEPERQTEGRVAYTGKLVIQ